MEEQKDTQVSLNEKRILKFWRENKIFEKIEILKRKILYRLASLSDDSDIAGVVGILFSSDKTEPVFKLNHTKLRIEKITIRNGEIAINFLPQ